MAFAEDLGAFFDTAGFAVEIALDGFTATFEGIFDNQYQEALGVGGQVARVTCRTSDAVGAVGRLLTVQGTHYRVVAHEPDGSGVSVLQMEEV